MQTGPEETLIRTHMLLDSIIKEKHYRNGDGCSCVAFRVVCKAVPIDGYTPGASQFVCYMYYNRWRLGLPAKDLTRLRNGITSPFTAASTPLGTSELPF